MNNLNLTWRITDDVLEYSYDNQITWINLIENEDINATVTILAQILLSDLVTVAEANYIYQYIEDNEILMNVLMEIDDLFYGYNYEVDTIYELTQSTLVKTVLNSARICNVLVKSTYVLEQLFESSNIKLSMFESFLIKAINTQLQYFIQEYDLINNKKLLQYTNVDSLNIISDDLESNESVLIRFFIRINDSTFAYDFFAQDKYVSLPTNSKLFIEMYEKVSTFATAYKRSIYANN